MTVPVRRCGGCRQVAPRSVLRRLVCDEHGRVTDDGGRGAPGRGLNVHPDRRCLERATGSRALARAFRRAGPFDLGALEQLLATAGPVAATAPVAQCQTGGPGAPPWDDHVAAGRMPADTDAEAGRRVMDAR